MVAEEPLSQPEGEQQGADTPAPKPKRRDYILKVHRVPLYAVIPLMDHLRQLLDRPDLGDVRADLHLEFWNLTEKEAKRLEYTLETGWATYELEGSEIKDA